MNKRINSITMYFIIYTIEDKHETSTTNRIQINQYFVLAF